MQATIELLSELIRCRPVTSDIAAVNRAMQVMHRYLQEKGVFCVIEEVNGRQVLFASTAPGKVHDLLLNAHIDVVPADPELFEPRLEGDRLYGRGASDDLSNAVCIAHVLCRQLGKASVGAIFTADEEIGGSTTAAMIQRGYVGRKFAIVMDGPNGRIAIAQKGIQIVKLIAKGRGGHASAPWSFDNPIDKLIDGYLRLRQQWPEVTAEQQWQNTMAPCMLEAGFAGNQIPDEASMVINIRYIQHSDREKILAQIKDLTGLELETDRHCDPVVSDENAPELHLLSRAIQKYMPEYPSDFVRMNGATDARHMLSMGVPIAITSVVGQGAHSRCEWAELPSIDKYVQILEEVIAEL
ncbi:MAG: M20 family metallopeptidase [Lentisphaerae bacterium]|jgi:succinyl-diaminopimelate desuccinylase|nr:M20 family metallopeptidase [Lentisphaerota bacterium]